MFAGVFFGTTCLCSSFVLLVTSKMGLRGLGLNVPWYENYQMHRCCLWRVLGLKITTVSRFSEKWMVQALGQLLQFRNFLQDVYTGDLCTVKRTWAVHTCWVMLQSRFFLSRFHVQHCRWALIIEILPGFRNPFVIISLRSRQKQLHTEMMKGQLRSFT